MPTDGLANRFCQSMADEGAQAVSIQGVATGRVRRCRPDTGQPIPLRVVVCPNNRIGAKAADARLAQLAAIRGGRACWLVHRRADVLTLRALAADDGWTDRARQQPGGGSAVPGSQDTRTTSGLTSFRRSVTTMSPASRGSILTSSTACSRTSQGCRPRSWRDATVRCALFSWALRKKLVAANPALSSGPSPPEAGEAAHPVDG